MLKARATRWRRGFLPPSLSGFLLGVTGGVQPAVRCAARASDCCRVISRCKRWFSVRSASSSRVGRGPRPFGLGVQAALGFGVPPFVAVLFGVMTGAAGGVLRDIVLNEVPMLFRPTTQLYATAVFAGGLVQVGLAQLGTRPGSALAAGALVTIGVRLLAVRYDWRLPAAREDA